MIIRTGFGTKPLNDSSLVNGNNPFQNVTVKRGFNQTPEGIRNQIQSRNLMNSPKTAETNPQVSTDPHQKIEIMKQVSRLNK